MSPFLQVRRCPLSAVFTRHATGEREKEEEEMNERTSRSEGMIGGALEQESRRRDDGV